MILYQCPIHDQDYHKHPECVDCIRIKTREAMQKEVNKRVPSVKAVPQMVNWSKRDRIDGGRVIEHLTPEPVFVKNKQEFRDLMKKTNSAEK